MINKILTFKKIKFYDFSYQRIIKKLSQEKGYLVIPAASALDQIKYNNKYFQALKKSTIAIFDSGYFCLCLFFIKFIKVRKFSGYKFIKKLLNDESLKKKKFLLLDSCIEDSNKNKLFLKRKKFFFFKNYVCPIYNKYNICDEALVKLILNYKPFIILINIGGGKQEVLAEYINIKSRKKCVIICSGAALSFHAGYGAKINSIIDSLYIGWIARIFNNPQIFLRRIFLSINLAKMVCESDVKVSYE
jgi:N-acetylglucosaminyldiphosphoundecaprenol N-acetyl-beta-D-mannosaminyltransferase